MKPLTPRQRQVIEAIRDYSAAHGYGPTIRELCATLGVTSTSTIHAHVTALKRHGDIIDGERGISRSLLLAGASCPRCAMLESLLREAGVAIPAAI